jgi:hypothetical protein
MEVNLANDGWECTYCIFHPNTLNDMSAWYKMEIQLVENTKQSSIIEGW